MTSAVIRSELLMRDLSAEDVMDLRYDHDISIWSPIRSAELWCHIGFRTS